MEERMNKDGDEAGRRRIEETLKQARSVIISSHENADGDSIGSLLGMTLALSRRGVTARPVLPNGEEVPPHYRFLPGAALLGEKEPLPPEPELFVALDCGNLERLASLGELARRSGCLVNIDHHEDNTRFGHLNLVEPYSSSTSEIVYRLLRGAGFELGAEEAVCFYVGIITDTGRFRNVNTTPQALRAAAELLELGVNPEEVVSRVYEESSLGYLRLLGRVLERAEMAEGYPLVHSYISREDLRETGVSMSETEDLIDKLRSAGEARVALLLKETEDGKTRASLRSRDEVSVGELARAFGGGGHARAAGFVSEKDRETVLEEVCRHLQNAGPGKP